MSDIQNNNGKKTAVIVGGGIVGLSSAYHLNKAGWQVTVLDKGDFTDCCSYGNAGMLVPSHFTPLAAPGIVAQGIKWMFSNKSPFYIKPSLNLNLLTWGLQFIRHANAQNVKNGETPIRDLNLYSKELYTQLEKDLSADIDLHIDGILFLFKTEKTADEEIKMAAHARELGLDAVVMTPAEAQEMEPDVKLDVAGAVHYRSDGHLYPVALMKALLQKLKDSGVHLLKHKEVIGIRKNQSQVTELITGGESFKADKFVLAGGSWLGNLAKLAELKVPVMPGKGYSFMTDAFQQKLRLPSLLLEARVALTPMGGHVRIGGTMELAAVNSKIYMNRVKGIVESVPAYYPEYNLRIPEKNKIWFGFRPCSPDGLPYLGVSKKYDNLIIAGGLGMMGLSLGQACGKVVCDLANGNKPEVRIEKFNPERFSR